MHRPVHASRHAIPEAAIKFCRAGAVQKPIAKSDEMSLAISGATQNLG
jgi:hypothetical protein